MAHKRSKMREWAHRTKEELNGVGGLAGLGGTALGAGGLTFLSGAAAVALSGGGAAIVLIAIGYAAVKAYPPNMRRAEDFVGKSITINELTLYDPPLTTVSIAGPSMAGKTTLRSRLAIEQNSNARTQVISAKIISLQTAPQYFVAVLDGGGEKLAQQFEVSAEAAALIIIVDHNSSDHEIVVDQKRLDDTKEMLNQIKLYLDEREIPKKESITFLINKRDLWQTLPQPEAALIVAYYEQIARMWEIANKAKRISVRPFSNNSGEDLADLMTDLKATVQTLATI